MSHRARMLVTCLVASAFAATAHAAPLDKTLDVAQGFAFDADATAPIGCLQSLQLGTVTLPADLDTRFPLAPSSSARCVAVLSRMAWTTGLADPIAVTGRFSASNRALLAARPAGPLDVTFQLAVYEYDPAAKKYFASVSSGSVDLKGTVDSAQVQVAAEHAPTPATPVNFEAQLTIKPQAVVQKVNLATSPGKVRARSWGAAP